MHAMILAAGLGTRMRPLSDERPKPLLPVGGRPLLAHLLDSLRRAGVGHAVINHGWKGEMIESAIGDGSDFGMQIRYSAEGPAPLETGGGILRALPLLGKGPFVVVNGDIWTEFDFSRLPAQPAGLAHIVLVPNPAHHPAGDFSLAGDRVRDAEPRLTYSGIGVFRPELFEDCPAGAFPLAPLLRRAIVRDQVRGECFGGTWIDVGSPDRLLEVERALRARGDSPRS